MPKKKKVLVALSGGVDSSVSTASLTKAGKESAAVSRGVEECWIRDVFENLDSM